MHHEHRRKRPDLELLACLPVLLASVAVPAVLRVERLLAGEEVEALAQLDRLALRLATLPRRLAAASDAGPIGLIRLHLGTIVMAPAAERRRLPLEHYMPGFER